jgi:HK97 family phage major capsid protein
VRLFDLKQQQQGYITAARKAAGAGDEHGYGVHMEAMLRIEREIQSIEGSKNNSILKMARANGGVILADGPATDAKPDQKVFSKEYQRDWLKWAQSGGTQIGATLYEGSDASGGYAVPVVVDDQIVPLAPQEMSVRQLASVIPTTMDIKIPTKQTFSTATAKAETSSFTESEPTIGQITLSAYMAGVLQEISWELAQDVPAFQAFAVDDMILAQQMFEENLFVNGSGSGQAQGLLNNVGAGIFAEPDSNANAVSTVGILSLIGTLNEVYHANASFLMARPTSVVIRKAQMQSNLFFPAFTSVGGQDYLFGYPVKYSAYMPAAARGNAPVIFGDYKRGYIIGDRGGSGINVKVLDQPLATQGLIQLLAYRRVDGRVRRSEALQQYNVSAS